MADPHWDDLRFVLAIAEGGSLAGAARKLKVNHTTVLRRLAACEKRLGLRLFERLPSGYVLTAGGEEIVAAAREIGERITAVERKLAGRDLLVSGSVRVTTTDSLMGSILPEILAEFRADHPAIALDISVSNLVLNLTKREADVAIRPAVDPPQRLIGRRISKLAFAIYARADHGKARDRSALRWLAPDDSLADTSVARWMRSGLSGSEIVLRADSFLALRQAAEAGLGVAALPCYLGDSSPALVRLRPPIAAMETELWVLTHADLRQAARIRTFTDFVGRALRRRRALLEGDMPRKA